MIRRRTIHDIQRAASSISGWSVAELRARDRRAAPLHWRVVVIHVAYKMGFGPTEIGRVVCRDHTTVIHAKRYLVDDEVRQSAALVEARLAEPTVWERMIERGDTHAAA